jgi:hypothetical protein
MGGGGGSKLYSKWPRQVKKIKGTHRFVVSNNNHCMEFFMQECLRINRPTPPTLASQMETGYSVFHFVTFKVE